MYFIERQFSLNVFFVPIKGSIVKYVIRNDVKPVIRNVPIRLPVSKYIMESSANIPSHISLSNPSKVDAPVTVHESAQVRGTVFSAVTPGGRESPDPSDVGGAHPVAAFQGPPLSLAPSDRGEAHLGGASDLPAVENEVGLMEREEDGTILLEQCNVNALLLDDVHDMYSAMEDCQER